MTQAERQALADLEIAILEEMGAQYTAGQLAYVHYSPAYDVQALRIEAILKLPTSD